MKSDPYSYQNMVSLALHKSLVPDFTACGVKAVVAVVTCSIQSPTRTLDSSHLYLRWDMESQDAS